MNEVILSICIPTNGRIEMVRKTLDSIFLNCKVPIFEFEVVISDNSSDDKLVHLLEAYKQFPNIKYEKTSCEGFMNSINALKIASGSFLKLHNNYTMFTSVGLLELVEFIKRVIDKKPIIFFKNTGKSEILEFDNFDDFSFELSYWNSWSTGISIWRDDFKKISNEEFDKMFPHVSLLILHYSKSFFIIYDNVYFINQHVARKGGYNLFKTFAVDYLSLMKSALLNLAISERTYKKIKEDLFYNFLPVWYFNTKIKRNEYSFDLSDIKKSIAINYGRIGYFKLVVLSYFLLIKKIIVRIFKPRF